MVDQGEASPHEVRNFVLVQLALTVVFLGLLFWMFGGIDADLPPIWVWVVLVVALVAAGYLAEQVWLRTEPLEADEDDPQQLALGIYAGQTVRRLAICEAPILLGVLLTFVVDAGAWPLLIAGAPGLALLAFEIWPSARNVSLTQTVLDSKGVDSGLLDGFVR